MTELQGETVIQLLQQLAIGARVLVVFVALLFGGLAFLSYKLGRRP